MTNLYLFVHPKKFQEYSSGDPTTPGSPDDMFHKDLNPCSDDMFLKDLNPCLTPYYAKSKVFY